MLENKLNKLKYKRVLEDLIEMLNKTNEQMAQNSNLKLIKIFCFINFDK